MASRSNWINATRRTMLRLLLLFPAAASSTIAQGAPGASVPAAAAVAGQFRISGTVTNAITGEPVRRASVAALSVEDGHTIESVLCDNEGRFALSGLAAAKYQLTASKRGFRTAYYDEHDEYSTAIVTGDGQDTRNLKFRITPGAVIHGVVTADGGDPVEGARVMLFARPRAHRHGERVAQADAATTDDTGAYEFSNLAAGEYLVAVMAEPWYSLHRASGGSGAKPVGSGAGSLDVAYPVTFFDSTTDEASATPIPVAGGSTEQANINLHAVPALHLFVQASRRRDGSIARPELRQSILGTQVSAVSMGLFDRGEAQSVEFAGVAPGHYELAQGDPPRIVELDASSNQEIDPAAGTLTVEVSGIVKNTSGAAVPAELRVELQPSDGEPRREAIQSAVTNGSFRLPAVPAGRWSISVASSNRDVAVVGISAGGRSEAKNELTVGDKPISVTLIVSKGTVRVTGFARKDGRGFAGAMIVLVPRNLDQLRELARRDQSDSDGSFSLRDAVPGQYTVVAIENGWDIDWMQPEVISRYLRRGTPVTVTDTQVDRAPMSAAVQVQSP